MATFATHLAPHQLARLCALLLRPTHNEDHRVERLALREAFAQAAAGPVPDMPETTPLEAHHAQRARDVRNDRLADARSEFDYLWILGRQDAARAGRMRQAAE